MNTKRQDILAYLKRLDAEMRPKGVGIVGLFGSFAREDAGVYSDIDIAVEKTEDFFQTYSAYDYFETVETIKVRIAQAFHRKSDIFDIGSMSPFRDAIVGELIRV